MQTYRVPANRIDELRTKLDKLFAKCQRKGLTGTMTVTYGDPVVEVREERDGAGTKHQVQYHYIPVTIDGEAPRFGGWQFAATVESMAGAPVNLMRCSPEFTETIPHQYRTGDPCKCEHCNKLRQRAETFVVHHPESGAYKQVGRQCLREFLGVDPSGMIASASFFETLLDIESEFGNENGMGNHCAPVYEVAYIVSLAARVVAVDGWKPRSYNPEHCTAQTIQSYLWACRGRTLADEETVRRFQESYVSSDRANALLARVVARIDELKAKAVGELRGDYETNLWALCHSGWCDNQHIGLVASLLAYAIKQEQTEAERKGLPSVAESKHIGTVGERLRGMQATVAFTKTFEGMYGAKTIVKFTSNDGNSLTWWASGVPDLKAGDCVTVTGTVKGHEEDRYTKAPATVLSRCKIEKAVEEVSK